MSRLRWILVALLVASTTLFAVGAIAERSTADTHTEPARAHTAERLGVAFDGFRPDRSGLLGAAICLVGVAVIMYGR